MKNLPCTDRLRQQIQRNLNNFHSIPHETAGLKAAAVALTVVNIGHPPDVYNILFQPEQADDAALILTRRSSKLRKHAGQWALPGGRMEPGEAPEEAALRELAEEVGLTLSKNQILGRLDDFTTRSGFVIKPVVLWAGREITLTPNPDEVAAIHRIPLAEFLRDDAPMLKKSADSEHPILFMPVGSSWIAAPTAALLYQFREVAIWGKATRVAHFDQPAFARK